MTYEEAMLCAVVGYAVRRVIWKSPKQVVRYNPAGKFSLWRSYSSGWYAKEEDTLAEDWYIEDGGFYGWYYPEDRPKKAWYWGLSQGNKWNNYPKYPEEYVDTNNHT